MGTWLDTLTKRIEEGITREMERLRDEREKYDPTKITGFKYSLTPTVPVFPPVSPTPAGEPVPLTEPKHAKSVWVTLTTYAYLMEAHEGMRHYLQNRCLREEWPERGLVKITPLYSVTLPLAIASRAVEPIRALAEPSCFDTATV